MSNPIIANTASNPGNPDFSPGSIGVDAGVDASVGDAVGEAVAVGEGAGVTDGATVGVGVGADRDITGKLILHSSIPPSML